MLRERAGIQSQELASRLGIDPSAMSNIESGKRSVKTSELVKIAGALSVSPLALLDEDSLPARLEVAARPDGRQDTLDGAAYARLRALSELQSVLSNAGFAAASNLNNVPQVDRAAGWKSAAETLAAWAAGKLAAQDTGTRRFPALVDAIERELRIDVLVEKYPGDPLSGAAITAGDFPLIFVNAQHPTPRCLFTVAHELGHLLLSHSGTITMDDNLAGSTPDERQANAFAAAFLMPADKVGTYLAQYGRGAESLARMLYDFGVSFESLTYRLHSLRQIDDAGRDSLREIGWTGLLKVIETTEVRDRIGSEMTIHLISRQGQRPAERPPLWLASRCFGGYRSGVISIRPLAGLFKYDPDALLDRINEDETKAAEVLENIGIAPLGQQPPDDELFAGSPVS